MTQCLIGSFVPFGDYVLIFSAQGLIIPPLFIAIICAFSGLAALSVAIFPQLYGTLSIVGSALRGRSVVIGSLAFGITFLDIVVLPVCVGFHMRAFIL